MTRPIRSGSYPLMNLAEDFGVDYGDVLLVADAARMIHRGVKAGDVPEGRMATFRDAAVRLQSTAGERVEELGDRIDDLVVTQ